MDFFRNRAETLAAALDLGDSEWHIDVIRRAMQEVAKQQRHACAEAINERFDAMEHGRFVSDAHSAAMNARITPRPVEQ